MKRIRRQLTDAEKLAAQKTKQLWLKKQKDHLEKFGRKMSQEKAAEELGWQNQGVFSQYMNAKLPIGMSVLLNLSAFFDVTPDDIFPELAKSLKGQHYEIRGNKMSLVSDGTAPYSSELNKPAMDKATKFLFENYGDVIELKGAQWASQMILMLYDLFLDPASENLNNKTILKLVSNG